MKKTLLIATLLCALLASGCYHAVIETGRTPSTMTINKSFASCWIYGLVPPSLVAAGADCPDGVAKVETRLSFVNQLVGAITLGIYTPMEIKVTCAEAGSSMLPSGEPDLTVAEPRDQQDVAAVFQQAAQVAVSEHRTVYVQFAQP